MNITHLPFLLHHLQPPFVYLSFSLFGVIQDSLSLQCIALSYKSFEWNANLQMYIIQWFLDSELTHKSTTIRPNLNVSVMCYYRVLQVLQFDSPSRSLIDIRHRTTTVRSEKYRLNSRPLYRIILKDVKLLPSP